MAFSGVLSVILYIDETGLRVLLSFSSFPSVVENTISLASSGRTAGHDKTKKKHRLLHPDTRMPLRDSNSLALSFPPIFKK